MSIKYLDQINNELNGDKRRYALADISDLKLDINNPRFASSTVLDDEANINDQNIINYLVKYGKLFEIIRSIIKNNGLYWEEWLSCVPDNDGKLIVLEGNRRISACKAILDETLLPEDRRPEINTITNPNSLYANISIIRVVIYTDPDDAQNYITAKHTNPEIKKWETFEQCNYFYSQFIQGTTIQQITEHVNVPKATIIKDIRKFGLFKNVFDATKKVHPNLEIEGTSILPLVDKFMPTLISNEAPFGLNLTFNESSYTYSPSPAKADIYDKILYMLGEAFFIREPLKGNDLDKRNNSNEYRISTDEIKSKIKVATLIEQNIRIPGLKDLIAAYNELPKSSSTQNGESSASSTTPAPSNTTPSQTQAESASTTTSNPATRQSAPQKEYEFFEDLDFTTLNPQNPDDLGLYRVCDEIVKISKYNSNAGYKNFPIAATFLLRSLIEQTLTRQLKKANAYERLCNRNNNNTKTPELGKMIEHIVKQCRNNNYILLNNDADLGKLFFQTFDGQATKDQLDTVIHKPHTIQPDKNFLNALAKQGIKTIIQAIISNMYVIEEAD